MKSFTIEGFSIQTDMPEVAPYCRMYDCEPYFEPFPLEELRPLVIDVIEQMIIGGKSAKDYYYDNCRGYKDSRLEPFNWRENKKEVIVKYTGTQGGNSYEIHISKS